MKKFIIAAMLLLAGILSANAQITKKGVKVDLTGGYYLNTANNDHVGQVELGVGYQFNNFLYLGAQTGGWGPIETDINNPIWNVPALGVLRLTVPMQTRIVPVVDVLGGVTASAFTKSDRYDKNRLPKYTLFEIMPGLVINISDTFALKGNVGYLMMTPKEGTMGREQNNLIFKGSIVISL